MNIRLMFAKRAFWPKRAEIYKQLAFALANNATPREEFGAMLTNARERGSVLTPVYQEWLSKLTGSAAGRMALAMKSTLPASEYALLASAEETGKLKEGLVFMGDAVSQIEEMRMAIVRAIRSVILPVILLIGLIWSVDAFFFPTVEASLPKRSWPFITKFVAGIAHDIGALTLAGLVIAPVILGIWMASLSRWTGRSRKIAEYTLVYSKYRDYQCCIFLVNLQFLMEAGHKPVESLERIHALSNPYMRWHLNRMLQAIVVRSINVGTALQQTGLFNDDLGELLSNYARWSEWHRQIGSIAKSALNLVVADVKRLGPMIQSMLTLVIGVCIMVVVAAGGFAIAKVLTIGIS